jgi:hypothetical protein
MAKISENLIGKTFSELFIFYIHSSEFFLFTFLSRSNQIELYHKSKIAFNLICIQLDSV